VQCIVTYVTGMSWLLP